MCLGTGERCVRRRAPPMLCLSDSPASSDPESTVPIIPALRARNCRPEIFTFDVEALQAAPAKPARRGTLGPRGKRSRRVQYPAKVRKYLPQPETDRPLRWLYMLCLLVFVQICCEEGIQEEQSLTAVLTMGDLQIYSSPVYTEPPGLFTNHSQGAHINHSQGGHIHHATLSWMMYQR
ncbi:radiation-inducible immediate-early gene IEX-1 [Aquarana catesbeiana]|uniref:radiation-inducible immediate-early gene IEX-1 n=1 Tax=Aquarana catesbeiana TaxID=8400 RepID=UPI003CC9D47F